MISDQASFELPERYVELQEEARTLASTVRDIAGRADEGDGIDPEIVDRLRKSGLARVVVPQEYGGRFPLVDALAVTVVREALAAESGHLDSMFAMQGIGSYAVSVAGSQRIRRRWLPAVAKVDALAAFALTEPGVGSDLRGVATSITERDGGVVVDGHKSFITNAGAAAFYCVLGREGSGFSLVLVPAASSGLTVESHYQIIAPHVLGDVRFDGVRVDADHRLGEPGQGFRHVLATLATFRASVAGAAVGLAEAALREAVWHAAERRQFGAPLVELGSVRGALASSWTEIEMARSLAYRAAAAASRDPRGALHLSSLAKVGATEMAGRVVDRCVQVMGRFGLVRGSKIERLYRSARPMRIYEGATDVLLDSLARHLVREVTA